MGSHREIDESGLLDKVNHNAYRHLNGILWQLCTMGSADIQFSVCCLSCFSACICKEQLKAVEKVFGYLKDFHDRQSRLIIRTSKDSLCCQLQMHLQGAVCWCIWRKGWVITCSFWNANPMFSFLWLGPCPQSKDQKVLYWNNSICRKHSSL